MTTLIVGLTLTEKDMRLVFIGNQTIIGWLSYNVDNYSLDNESFVKEIKEIFGKIFPNINIDYDHTDLSKKNFNMAMKLVI